MKILLAGHRALVTNLKQFLESECHVVSHAETQDEALELVRLYSFDALVTKLELLQGSGEKLILALRNDKRKVPILVLYPETKQDPSLVEVLDMGADDAMRLPIDKNELMARVRTIVRRPNGYAQSILEVGALSFDLVSKTFRINDKAAYMSGLSNSILEFLMLRAGRILTREQILDHCWSETSHIDERTVDTYVNRLRRSITNESGNTIQGDQYIQTVSGCGYIMQAPEEQNK